MSEKKKNKIKVSFPWYSSTAVTGSAVLIETGGKKILIEFGLHQEVNSLLEDYRNNNKKLPFKAKELDYIIVLHCHIDHIGLIPRLYKEGCTASIISPVGNKDLYKIMVTDSAHILQKNAEDLSKKAGKEILPIYGNINIEKSLLNWQEYNFMQKIKLSDDIELQFYHSSHIINSAQLKLWVTNNARVATVAITSDLGNVSLKNQFYTEKIDYIDKANLLIMESTYANPEKKQAREKDRLKDLEKLESIISEVCEDKGGKVLIPVFALQRAQVILSHLYNIFKNKKIGFTILLDSPLLLKVNDYFLNHLTNEQQEQFEEVLAWDKIKKCQEFSDTMEWVNNDKPCVFLSCSGMMTAGRSVAVCKNLLRYSNNAVVFVGYSAEGSLAAKLKSKRQKTVNIEGQRIPCNASIINLNSFSSHMQREELLGYPLKGNFDKIALVHGDFDKKVDFAEEMQELLFKKNKTTKVVCVNKTTTINL